MMVVSALAEEGAGGGGGGGSDGRDRAPMFGAGRWGDRDGRGRKSPAQ